MAGRIFLAAILAGAIAGVLMTVMQHVAVFPMIFEAETYEVAGEVAADATGDGGAAGGGALEEHEAWGPAEGLERTAYSGLANVITAVGFGLLLAVGFALRGGIDWRRAKKSRPRRIYAAVVAVLAVVSVAAPFLADFLA